MVSHREQATKSMKQQAERDNRPVRSQEFLCVVRKNKKAVRQTRT